MLSLSVLQSERLLIVVLCLSCSSLIWYLYGLFLGSLNEKLRIFELKIESKFGHYKVAKNPFK